MFDGEQFGQQMVDIVRSYVEAELAPLREENAALRGRIDELDRREVRPPDPGEPGPAGCDGHDGVGIADALINAEGNLVLTLTDGRIKTLGRVVGTDGIDGADGKDGQDGSDAEPTPPAQVDMDAVRELVTREVTAAVAELPPAAQGEPGEPGRDGLDGAAGKDGTGLADAIIDREGKLVLTMTNGATKSLGVVIGRDGANGIDGKDGKTFTLDDFDIVPLADERTFKMCFTRGEIMHSFEFAFPVVLDRGVYSAGKQYEHGDAVTWAGSLWIAQRSTDAKPDSPDGGWRLAVKRGRDGKDAK
ncbi:hypothetical protein ACQEPB_00460 [Novosphingobium fluoreni]|uniref:hypothetical protein n=1 Tax=Novosphingobium fluoreni TaxID=1391222 RepID=UPI003DA17E2F